MGEFILQLGIMSLQASIVIGVVLVVRQLFAGMHVSKKYMNILWMLPYLCMVCPWKLEGAWGFWRNPRTYQLRRIEQIVTQMKAPGGYVSNMDIAAVVLRICGIVWILGVIGICVYTIWSYAKLRREILCSIEIAEKIYAADDIKVSFVLGIFKPRIYLPSGINGETLEYVIAHERTHINRRDPLKKIIVFWITCLHWFNPLAWVAFHYLEKDMEMACDEETILSLGLERKKDYASALLTLATGKRLFLGAPLAFDEGNVKSRIRNIVKYKKALGIVSALAVILIVVLSIGFMTKEQEANIKIDSGDEFKILQEEIEKLLQQEIEEQQALLDELKQEIKEAEKNANAAKQLALEEEHQKALEEEYQKALEEMVELARSIKFVK